MKIPYITIEEILYSGKPKKCAGPVWSQLEDIEDDLSIFEYDLSELDCHVFREDNVVKIVFLCQWIYTMIIITTRISTALCFGTWTSVIRMCLDSRDESCWWLHNNVNICNKTVHLKAVKMVSSMYSLLQ